MTEKVKKPNFDYCKSNYIDLNLEGNLVKIENYPDQNLEYELYTFKNNIVKKGIAKNGIVRIDFLMLGIYKQYLYFKKI